MGETPTHLHLKLAVAKSLEGFGYKTQTEKWFPNGRMDIHAINQENGAELEIEIWKTNLPDRFIIRVVDGKLVGIDCELDRSELEAKKAVWKGLSEEEPKPIYYREREQYEICQQFLTLLTSGKIQLESSRILDSLNEIFSYMRRKRSYR